MAALEYYYIALVIGYIIIAIYCLAGLCALKEYLKNEKDKKICCIVDDKEKSHPLTLPRRTGHFKFVSHGPYEFVLYAEYELWEGDSMDAYHRKRWQRANGEDLDVYYANQHAERI